MAGNTVKEKIEAGARLLDVRTPEEFRDGTYPGAVNIPWNRRTGRSCSSAPPAPVALRGPGS
jgi:rhodanese-related sulfurtransferase